MAKLTQHFLGRAISGMIGRQLVFRRVRNKTIVAAAPSPAKTSSKAQQQQRKRFKEAMRYAKAQMADTESKAAYEAVARIREMPNAFNVAVSDFFNAPEIAPVDLSRYTGKIGDKIVAKVTDDFMVDSVWVRICDGSGNLLEEGGACMQLNRVDWHYTSTAAPVNSTGIQVIITAKDLPGNETVYSCSKP